MPLNYIKKYDQLLDLNHLTESQRKNSLRAIFDRDIADNSNFLFRSKIIRPLKREDLLDIESLVTHLTFQTEEERDKRGKVIKSRNVFDIERSRRLHWILPHIKEKIKDFPLLIFSAMVRIGGRDKIRTYIYNRERKYVTILEPQRSGADYYLITAYYLEKKFGGHKTIEKKYKQRLPQVY